MSQIYQCRSPGTILDLCQMTKIKLKTITTLCKFSHRKSEIGSQQLLADKYFIVASQSVLFMPALWRGTTLFIMVSHIFVCAWLYNSNSDRSVALYLCWRKVSRQPVLIQNHFK